MSTVAKILLFDQDDNVLVLRRSDTHPRYPREADLPGGEVEEGEDPVNAVRREVSEETSLTINKKTIDAVHSRRTPEGRLDWICKGRINDTKPKIIISWEHESYEWIPFTEVYKHLETTDDYMIVVKEYLTKIT